MTREERRAAKRRAVCVKRFTVYQAPKFCALDYRGQGVEAIDRCQTRAYTEMMGYPPERPAYTWVGWDQWLYTPRSKFYKGRALELAS